MENSTAKYLVTALKAVLTLAFVGAGLAKIAGVDMMVATFDALGLGQWFRYVTASIEIGAAVLLWWPGRQMIGAALLLATMIGAVLAHAFLIGPTAVPAIVLGIASAIVAYVYRNQAAGLRARTA